MVVGVKEKAARILEIDRKTLYRRIQELQERSGQVGASRMSHPAAPVEGQGEVLVN